MGTGPVTRSAGSRRRWTLNAETAARTQGLIASHFGHLPCAAALLLALPPGCGGDWLRRLQIAVPISDAGGSREDVEAATLAFTWTGLATMGLPASALDSFSAPFREGMHQLDRRRRLGDLDDGPQGTVIAGGPVWSGNAPDPFRDVASATPTTVHAVLLIYAADEARLAAREAAVTATLAASALQLVRRLALSLRTDDAGIAREHFGFADGLSQPVPTGAAVIDADADGSAAERHWHGVPIGEFLIGHPNAHHELAPGPIVAATAPGATPPSQAESALVADGAPRGFLNLGRDGSYLVLRELRQDVAAFWNSLDEAAAGLAQPGIDACWLAERLVGRGIDGDGLRPGGIVPREGGQPANAFGYAEADLQGFGCPLGSHVRRANPRDSLPSRDGAHPRLDDAGTLLAAANAHRILRRGRKFGPDIADPRRDDAAARGLLFIGLNTDLVRQFEFVQQSWLLNTSFATLFDETDPLLGPAGAMTIPQPPLRLRPAVKSYVRFVGGDYFFLPSLPALRYLAGLQAPPASP